MTYTFDAIEDQGDNTKVIFRKEGAILGVGEQFADASGEKPQLLQEYSAEAVATGDYDDASVSRVQHAAALDALILHRIEKADNSDHREIPLNAFERYVLRKGNIAETVKLIIQ